MSADGGINVYGETIGTYRRSYGRYHSRPPTAPFP